MKISILIPCYNEEKTIRACIESCLNQTRRADEIIVVDDCSTDTTPPILWEFGNQIRVVRTSANRGKKSYAQEFGMAHVTGDVFITTDADTLLDSRFVEVMEERFKNAHTAAVAGYVKSLRHNWLTACREIDYLVAQKLHKKAASSLGAFFVIPGCAGAFRTALFKRIIAFEHDTMTEDLDFTYKFYEQGLAVEFAPDAIAYTQDPPTLSSSIRQVRRWHRGSWQNIWKHRDILMRPAHAFELSMVYTESLFFPLTLFTMPILNVIFMKIVALYYILLIVLLGTWGAVASRRPDLLYHAPFYPIVSMINAYLFFEQLAALCLRKNGSIKWHKPDRLPIAGIAL